MTNPLDPENSSEAKMDSDGDSAAKKFASLTLRDITEVTDARRLGKSNDVKHNAQIIQERPERRGLPIPSPTANTDFAIVSDSGGPSGSPEAPRQCTNYDPELQQIVLMMEKMQERMTFLERGQTKIEALPTFKAPSYVCGLESESEAISEIESATRHFQVEETSPTVRTIFRLCQ